MVQYLRLPGTWAAALLVVVPWVMTPSWHTAITPETHNGIPFPDVFEAAMVAGPGLFLLLLGWALQPQRHSCFAGSAPPPASCAAQARPLPAGSHPSTGNER